MAARALVISRKINIDGYMQACYNISLTRVVGGDSFSWLVQHLHRLLPGGPPSSFNC
jgi:hypothetical protein